MQHFSELPLSSFVHTQLEKANFTIPTEVQASAIPAALQGKDILATAQTGTGKTLAFMIPIAEHLLASKLPGVQALVLVPTRELAIQVVEQFDLLRGNRLPAAATLIGGAPEKKQIQHLKTANVIVATPGRLQDFMLRKLVDFRGVKILVLDEADRMLDMGFLPSIKRIVPALPKKRQTMCFSATLEASIVHIIGDYMHNPVRFSFGSTSKPCESVTIQAFEVMANQRFALLQQLLEKETGRCLVFARTKRNTESLAKKLMASGFNATMLHGDRSQSQRNTALAAFQEGSVRILVATDVASRGIHVDDVAHVINYELPELAEDLIHRVGRTGRAGALGKASVLVMAQEMRDFRRMEQSLGVKIERFKADGDLAVEVRPGPVQVSGGPVQIKGSKRVMLPGEVLQRHQPVN